MSGVGTKLKQKGLHLENDVYQAQVNQKPDHSKFKEFLTNGLNFFCEVGRKVICHEYVEVDLEVQGEPGNSKVPFRRKGGVEEKRIPGS